MDYQMDDQLDTYLKSFSIETTNFDRDNPEKTFEEVIDSRDLDGIIAELNFS